MDTQRQANSQDFEGDAKSAVIDLIYRLADDDLVIGHRNSEWTGLGPILEADIAMSSIAQDQIGQAQAYYGLLHELGEPDPDSLVFGRRPEEFHCASLCALPKGSWAFSTVRQYLYDAGKRHRLAALCESAYRPLAHLARKLRGEQKYHLMHGRMWITRLGRATDESHARMQEATDELFPHALGLFETTEHSRAIADHALGPDEDRLRAAWQAEVTETLTAAGLNLPANARPILGGRRGQNVPALAELLDAIQEVYKLDPTAKW